MFVKEFSPEVEPISWEMVKKVKNMFNASIFAACLMAEKTHRVVAYGQ